MKIYILLIIFIVLPVFCLAQDGANAKKPSEDGSKDENKTSEIEPNEIVKNKFQSYELEFLRSMKGKYAHDVDLLNIDIINQRLKKLLGDKFNFISDISEFGPSSPINVDNDIFSSNTCQQHNCYYTNYIIVADIKKNLLYVGIREEEYVNIYSENEDDIPGILRNWENNKY